MFSGSKQRVKFKKKFS